MQASINKLRRDPIGFIRQTIYKTLIAPIRYRKKGGYDAARYWGDRLARYGTAMRRVGDEGLTEKANLEMYESAGAAFLDLCRKEGIDFPTARVLEIGSGNGFYAGILKHQGVKQYLGVDIADALFPILAERLPGFQLIRRDITADLIDGEFDLILMIDVIEHIVSEKKLVFAMANVQGCLADNSRFMVTPVVEKGRQSLFYVRFWTVGDIKWCLSECTVGEPIPFRNSNLLIARKLSKPITTIGAN